MPRKRTPHHDAEKSLALQKTMRMRPSGVIAATHKMSSVRGIQNTVRLRWSHMLWAWISSCTRPFAELIRPKMETHFVLKDTAFRDPTISQKHISCKTSFKNRVLRIAPLRKVWLQCHQVILCLPHKSGACHGKAVSLFLFPRLFLFVILSFYDSFSSDFFFLIVMIRESP